MLAIMLGSSPPVLGQQFVPPQSSLPAAGPAPQAALATTIDVSYPPPDSTWPLQIRGEVGCTWQLGSLEQWVLRGSPSIEQGNWSVRGDVLVVWIDRDPTASETKLIVYAEGNAEVRWPRAGSDPAAPVYNRIVDAQWIGRLRSSAALQWAVARTEPGDDATYAPIRQRAEQARQTGIAYAAQPTSFQDNLLPPPANGGVMIQQPGSESFTISPQTGDVRPPTNLPAPPRSLPPPPLSGVQMYTTRIELFPRQPSVPLNARSFRGDNPHESITVISGGVRVVVDSQELAARPELAGEPSRLVSILADSAIWWRTAADPATGGVERNEIYLEGDVVFNIGRRTVYSDRMYYDATYNRGTILQAEFLAPFPSYDGLVRMKADVLQQLDENSFQAYGAALTGSRMGVPRYWLQSDQISVDGVQSYGVDEETGELAVDPYSGQPTVETHYFAESRGNRVFMNGVPVLYWPRLRTSLDEPNFYLRSVEVGSDRIFGTQIRTRWDLHQLFGIRRKPPNTVWLGDVDYLSNRGIGLGSEYTYRWPSFLGIQGPTEGIYRSWYIRDKGLDNLGADRRTDPPESEDRGVWFLNHRQQFTPDFELKAEIGLIRTRNFLEQYFQQEWDWNKDYTTGFLLERRFGNQSLDLWTEIRVNDFFTQTNWLPRLDYFVIGQPVGESNWVYTSRSHIGYANFQPLKPPESAEDLAEFSPLAWEVAKANGLRTGTRQLLEYPLQAGPFRLVPYLLGDATYWQQDLNGNDVFRLYGQTGLSISLPFYRIDPTVHSTLFNVNGLAHKVSWDTEIGYAGADQNFEDLPLYDQIDDDAQEFFRRRFAFSTFGISYGQFVPPEFEDRQFARRYGMQRYVTSPSAEIAADLSYIQTGFHNRWQTKRGMPGRESIIDWITFDVDATIFPDADRDNFGQVVGLLNYDFRWFIGDRFSLLSDGFFDFFSQGMKTVSVGAQWHRPLIGDIYVGLRSIEGPLSSNVLSGHWAYRLSEKWGLRANTLYDFGSTGNIGQQLAAVYIGESFLWQLGANYDVSRDNVGIIFGLEPRFLVRPQFFRPGYSPLPPPSSEYLE